MPRIVTCIVAALVIGAIMPPATSMAQTATGNRANGRDYEPTPAEVLPRERAAGITPSTADQAKTDSELEKIDRSLLRSHGLSTSSIPNMTNKQ